MVTETQTSNSPALLEEASAPHLGNAGPGLSPVLIPLPKDGPLREAAF